MLDVIEPMLAKCTHVLTQPSIRLQDVVSFNYLSQTVKRWPTMIIYVLEKISPIYINLHAPTPRRQWNPREFQFLWIYTIAFLRNDANVKCTCLLPRLFKGYCIIRNERTCYLIKQFNCSVLFYYRWACTKVR